MKRTCWILAMAAVLLAGVACSGDVTGGGTPGTLTLRLTTPHADDGAMTFRVSGPAIHGATLADGSLRLFTRLENGSTLVGVLVGAVASGAVVTLQVAEVRGPDARYTATVLEVADRQDALRGSLVGYELTVSR